MNDPVICWLSQQLHKKISEKNPEQNIYEINLKKVRGNPDNGLFLKIIDSEKTNIDDGC